MNSNMARKFIMFTNIIGKLIMRDAHSFSQKNI